jgi:hypothetical protein
VSGALERGRATWTFRIDGRNPEAELERAHQQFTAWLTTQGVEPAGDWTLERYDTIPGGTPQARLSVPVNRVPSPYDEAEPRTIAELNGDPVCRRVCEYAMDVGMAMHAPDPQRSGGCGNCGHYQAPLAWEGDQG